MLLKYLKYRYVKARMIAYLDGELSVDARRFIARQIDENPRCHQEYVSARRMRESLKRELPVLGKASSNQLDNLWLNIQAELNHPDQSATFGVQRTSYSLTYGVAMLMIAVVIMMPFVVDIRGSGSIPIQQQPMPESTTAVTSSAAVTPEAFATSIVYAETYSQTQATASARIPLQNTPAPRTPGS